MFHKLFLIIFAAIFLAACGGQKKVAVKAPPAPRPVVAASDAAAATAITGRLVELDRLITAELSKPSDTDGSTLRQLSAERLERKAEFEKVSGQSPTAAEALSPAKPAKAEKIKSATSLSCESQFSDTHDRQICFRAQAREAEEAAEKARRAALKSEPPSMRKEREKERKADDRRRKIERSQEWAIENSGLSGCEPGTVWIDPYAVIDTSRGLGGWWVRSFVHGKLEVTNRSPVSVDIRNMTGGNEGLTVRNLCPGGTLKIGQYLAPSIGYGGYAIIQYSATAHDPASGRTLNDYSPQVHMISCYYGSYCRTEYIEIWHINLR
jgi:hypothetical protein